MPSPRKRGEGAATSAVRSERLHLDHARDRLDGARDLRRDLEAARQLHLDLGALAQHEHYGDFAVTLAVEPFGNALGWRLVAQEHAQRLLQLGGRLVERLSHLDARAHFLTL